MSDWKKMHAEAHGSSGRGRTAWRLKVEGGWLVLVRAVDDAVWGGLTFVPDPGHEHPPDPVEDDA
jgi:hypothetical protein